MKHCYVCRKLFRKFVKCLVLMHLQIAFVVSMCVCIVEDTGGH